MLWPHLVQLHNSNNVIYWKPYSKEALGSRPKLKRGTKPKPPLSKILLPLFKQIKTGSNKIEFKSHMDKYINVPKKCHRPKHSSLLQWQSPLVYTTFSNTDFGVWLLLTKINCEEQCCDNELLFTSSLLSSYLHFESAAEILPKGNFSLNSLFWHVRNT